MCSFVFCFPVNYASQKMKRKKCLMMWVDSDAAPPPPLFLDMLVGELNLN